MMDSPYLSKMPKSERRQLLADLNYLNMSEIKSFCRRHAIPYRVAMETRDGRRKITRDIDRKGAILDRIRHFLETGVVLEETCFRSAVVCFDPLPKKLTENDRLFYGQYDKTNRTMIALLRRLTGGQFENGAIARILAREFWNSGKAPTFQEYAVAWIEASKQHTKPNPEWAFLSDRASKGSVLDWKKMRDRKALKVLKTLEQIASGRGEEGRAMRTPKLPPLSKRSGF
jgi:hypothetical protein